MVSPVHSILACVYVLSVCVCYWNVCATVCASVRVCVCYDFTIGIVHYNYIYSII